MSSTNFNVFRYSLLGAGVVYGFVHRHNLEAAEEQKQKQAEWKKEEKLIRQAKAEYAKLNAPKEKPASTAAFNLEDPNLDFGKVLESLVQKLE